MKFVFKKLKDQKRIQAETTHKVRIHWAMPLILVGSLLLGGCGIIEESMAGESGAAVEETTEDTEGVIKTSSADEETQENGPFKVTLKDAKMTQMPPEKTLARDLVELSIVVEVMNESTDLNTIHPNQAVIYTDTNQEVIADQSLSDKVGGDFSSKQTKQGEIIFTISGKLEDLSIIRCVIDTGYDSEYNWLGESLEFIFEF